MMAKAPWLEVAEHEMGVHETPGPKATARIVEYLKSTSLGKPDNQSDETPWCSAFVNWCMEKAGIKGTDSAWARSWMDWGQEPDNDNYLGAVVILERGENSGHVGFLVDWDEGRVELLGGNQSDMVCKKWFPIDKVLGYRVPA